jgi:hypothetical protein
MYLKDSDFEEMFKMSKAQYEAMPKWKALQLKKQVRASAYK